MKTIIVWFRNDLRVHDHPALAAATKDGDRVVPVFILNDHLLAGRSAGANRNRFLLESLQDLKKSLQDKGGDLVVRRGAAASELTKIVRETSANAIYYTADYTPFAVKRDHSVQKSLGSQTELRAFPGRLAIDSLENLTTRSGTPHKVFTPFWKQWMDIERRDTVAAPRSISLPSGVHGGALPKLSDIAKTSELSPDVITGGESEARMRLTDFLNHAIKDYHQGQNDMAEDQTSRLSTYLHFGCLSPREIETMLPDNAGAQAWHRQLCWREFYNYIVFRFPDIGQEFQERYRRLTWDNNQKLFEAWQNGTTGYPAVDAGMRQLRREGWMHNRARLIVGSFLTKDLWLDWRSGEAHFMHWLVDGDTANNNGNWQWIASVGVDPAPVYRRLYNPTLQQKKFDPTGQYVHRYVPELKHVPDKYLAEPWTMPPEVQKQSKCIIGKDYPAPIVDHKEARLAALEQYRSI